jgi:hypothetical protein
VEYAKLHMESNNPRYMDGARRIVLTMSTKSLLVADVSYFKKLCYESFRRPVWKREAKPATTTLSNIGEDEALCVMFQLIEIHIIRRQETMTQLKPIYNEIRSSKCLSDSRSLDLLWIH